MRDDEWRRVVRPERGSLRADVDAELRFHLEMIVRDLLSQGWSLADAHREAQHRFGPARTVHEDCFSIDRRVHRRAIVANVMSLIAQDFRFALRILWRSPAFSVLAILCLTLGIGSNAAVYSWIEGVLLRPYAQVEHQDRLFAFAATSRGVAGYEGISWPELLDYQRSSTLVESFVANNITGATLSIGDRADRVVGGIVSANYFRAIGVRPLLGRGFEAGEDLGRDAHPVVVISYQLWAERFEYDQSIIGRKQIFNGVPHTIIGVTPEGFLGTFVGYSFQFWVPASQEDVFNPTGYKLEDRGARWVEGMIRLKPGVTQQQAQVELSTIAARLERQFPALDRGRGVELVPLWKNPFNNAGTLYPTLRIALLVVAFVLLIACANVGNLLFVRSLARRREMMVRLAIGAGRSRLVSQLLTEGLILSVSATASGILVAYLSRHALVLFFPPRGGIAYNFPGSLDTRVLAVSSAVCIVATLVFALLPALETSKLDLAAAIKSESVIGSGGRGRVWVRSALVLVQISLSFVLLVGAGLLIKSLEGMRGANPGFSTDHVLVSSVSLSAAGYDTARAIQFQDQLIERVRGLPGVDDVAYTRVLPFSYRPYSSSQIAVDGYDAPPDQQPTAQYDEIGPAFLATLALPMVSGREFTRDDNEQAPPVAIVNETMATRFWRGTSPLGKRVQVKGRWLRVVGMARDAKYSSFMEIPKPFFYVPLRQNYSGVIGLVVRTKQAPEDFAAPLVREIQNLDPNLAPGELITMRTQLDRATSPQRAAVSLLEVFAGVALFLAVVGLYGVMSYVVSQSTRELGLRMAVGAASADLLRLVMARGLALTAIGTSVGAVTAVAVTRLMGDLLFGVSPTDPLAFVVAGGLMTVAAGAACLFPALRAASTDPLLALRQS